MFQWLINNNELEKYSLEKNRYSWVDFCSENLYNSNSKSLLHYVDNIEIAKLLIESGVKLNIQDEDGNTPLHIIKNKNIKKLLVNKGADISILNNNKEKIFNLPIHEAVIENNIEKVNKYLNEIDINLFNENDETALMIAITNGNLEIANLIIDAGADITCENDDEDTAFSYAVWADDININFIQSLIDKIAVLNVSQNYDWDCLYKDFKINMKMIDTITSSEVMIDYQFDKEYIKKIEEIKVINIQILKLLIELNENMTLEYKSKYIENYIHPIFLAIKQKNLEMIKLLIESGTDINIHDKDDSSLLHLVDDDIEITRFLIKSGIDLNYQEKEQGNTPLHYASDSNVRKILIEAGADINIKNKLNQSIRL